MVENNSQSQGHNWADLFEQSGAGEGEPPMEAWVAYDKLWEAQDTDEMARLRLEELKEVAAQAAREQVAREQAEENERRIRDLAVKFRQERAAKRLLDAEEMASGIGEVVVGTAWSEAQAATPASEDVWVVEGLMDEECRVVFAAERKSGKTTAVLNLVRCWATGAAFFGSLRVERIPEGRTVLWINCELSVKTARRWLARLGMDEESGSRIAVAHLRGAMSRYNLTTLDGQEALRALLVSTRAERLVIDPIAPLATASGLDVAKDVDAQVFINAVDEAALVSGVKEVVYVTHTGKAVVEGEEKAKGAGRWEDSADSIWTMGKEKTSTKRWFRAEGRDVDYPEVLLDFDPDTLTLLSDPTGDRYDAKLKAVILKVLEVVNDEPGIHKSPLRDHPKAKGARNAVDSAVSKAVSGGLIRESPAGSAKEHFITADGLRLLIEAGIVAV